MFSHEGNTRSDRQNRILAGYLAAVGGYVNSCGFVLIGSFTSHVTGNVGRLANDAASGQRGAATTALVMVVAFFFGAFLVSVILESNWAHHVSRAYASALGVEAAILGLFVVFFYATNAVGHPRILDTEGALLCVAMGMQNGLVTRLSGAVVRTTHLTGVITDLGIEAARWFRYSRKSVAEIARVQLVVGPNVPERPAVPKVRLLSTIAVSFLVGGLLGAIATIYLGGGSMLVAVGAIASCSLYAVYDGRSDDATAEPPSRP